MTLRDEAILSVLACVYGCVHTRVAACTDASPRLCPFCYRLALFAQYTYIGDRLVDRQSYIYADGQIKGEGVIKAS